MQDQIVIDLFHYLKTTEYSKAVAILSKTTVTVLGVVFCVNRDGEFVLYTQAYTRKNVAKPIVNLIRSYMLITGVNYKDMTKGI